VNGALDVALLIGAAVVLLAAVAVKLAQRVGVPGLLVFLGLGLLLGESGAGLRFNNASLTRDLGLLGLVVILAEGGLTTRWSAVRPVLPLAGLLASVGVAISIIVVAAGAVVILGAPIREALLYGAVLGSTDAAAVFSVLRRVRLRPRLIATLEAESGTNDPAAVLAVMLLVEPAFRGESGAGLVLALLQQVGVGVLVGAVVAVAGAAGLRRIALPAVGLYPLAVLALVLLSYAGATLGGGSGFLALYLTALVLGNSDLPHRASVVSFAEGLAWLAQIGLFVLLGLLASPSRLAPSLLPALALGAVLLLAARPLAVLLIATPLRVPWREQALLAWAGLRGAVPIVLTTLPLTAGTPGATRLFDVVFVLVAVLTLLQAPTIAPLARALRVLDRDASRDLDVDAAPLGTAGAELLSLVVRPGSGLAGVRVWQLRLPEIGAALALVVRGGGAVVPDERFALRVDDELVVVCGPAGRAVAQQRLRAVAAAGGLAPPPPPR